MKKTVMCPELEAQAPRIDAPRGYRIDAPRIDAPQVYRIDTPRK